MLAQPVCASAAERNWSVYGVDQNGIPQPNGAMAVADKLVYTAMRHFTFRLSLKKTSYHQAAEKWDSDSDSDESDDEDLEM